MDPIMLIYFLFYTIKLIKKYFHRLEPVHVFDISPLFNLLLMIVLKLGDNVQQNLESDWDPFCLLGHFLFNVVRISTSLELSAAEIHRFLFIYWSSSYHERICTKDAMITIAIIKVVVALICVVGCVLDPEAVKCRKHTIFICNYLRKNNIFWITLPTLVSMIIILTVSGYLIRVILKQSKINPVEIQNPQNQMSKKPSQKSVLRQNEEAIERRNENPHMFFKVQKPPNQTERVVAKSNIFPLLNVAKKCLSVNLLSLCILLSMVPMNSLNMYVFMTNTSCPSDQNTQMILKSVALSGGLMVLIVPYLTEKKLDQF